MAHFIKRKCGKRRRSQGRGRDIRRALHRKQNGRCFYCGRRFSPLYDKGFHPLMITIDHIIPIASGGQDKHENRIGACWTCNNAKADTGPGEFYAMIRRDGPPKTSP